MPTTTRSTTQERRATTELDRDQEFEALEAGAARTRRTPPTLALEPVDETVDRAAGRDRVRPALRMASDRRISDEVIDELLAGASTEKEIAGTSRIRFSLACRKVKPPEMLDHRLLHRSLEGEVELLQGLSRGEPGGHPGLIRSCSTNDNRAATAAPVDPSTPPHHATAPDTRLTATARGGPTRAAPRTLAPEPLIVVNGPDALVKDAQAVSLCVQSH
jgi:hypothetical protein